MHENVPRLGISLTKKSHDLQICTRPTCRCILSEGIRKKIHTGSDKLLNSAFFFLNINGVYKFDTKNTSGWKIFFMRKPSPRILRHVGRVQI